MSQTVALMDLPFFYLLRYERWWYPALARPSQQDWLNIDCLSIRRGKHIIGRFKVKFRITGKCWGNGYFFFFSELLRGLVSKVQASRCAENCFKTWETGEEAVPGILKPTREPRPFFSGHSCWYICRQVVVRSVEQRIFREQSACEGKRHEVSSGWDLARQPGQWAECREAIVRIPAVACDREARERGTET